MLRFIVFFLLAAALQASIMFMNAATGFADSLIYAFYDLPTILLLWGQGTTGARVEVSTFQLVALPTVFYSLVFAVIATVVSRFVISDPNRTN